MKQKSLDNSRLEFQWQTNMIDTRSNMEEIPPRTSTSVPTALRADSREAQDLLLDCMVYQDLREGLDPEQVVANRATY